MQMLFALEDSQGLRTKFRGEYKYVFFDVLHLSSPYNEKIHCNLKIDS